jgi:hypothetical protein
MAIYIEDHLPGIRENGLNTAVPVDFTDAPSVSLPLATVVGGTVVATNITSTSATALTVGQAGTTNPGFTVDTATASSESGLKVKSASSGDGLAVSVTSSVANEPLTIDAKGSGSITLNGTATGAVGSPRVVSAVTGTAATAGGAKAFGMGSGTVGIFFGSGAPTVSAGQGSLYLRTDGAGVDSRLYVNTDGGTTWVDVTTSA